MEQAVAFLNSPNFLWLAIVVLLVVLVLAFLSKKGIVSYNGNGLKVGKSDSDTRLLLMRQVDYVNAFILAKQQELMSELRKLGMTPNELHVLYVFEKMLDQVMYWLLVNNIRLDRTYVQAKAQTSKMVIHSAIGEVNPSLLDDRSIVEFIEKISIEYTEEILSGLVQIKNEEEKYAC